MIFILHLTESQKKKKKKKEVREEASLEEEV